MKRIEEFLTETCLFPLIFGFVFLLIIQIPKIVVWATGPSLYLANTEHIRRIISKIIEITELTSVFLFIVFLLFGVIFVFIKYSKISKESKVYKCLKELYVFFALLFFVIVAINIVVQLFCLWLYFKLLRPIIPT